MSVVADSSVLVAALVDGGAPGTWAEELLASRPLHAPEIVLAEVSNTLRRLERARGISAAEANAAQADLMKLHIELFPFAPFADRIWQLRHSITSYDAWYVALAEALNLPLATLDRRLMRSSVARCRFLLPDGK